VLSRLHRLPYLTVAYIDGYALGGGAELASACDWRVLTSTARIGFVQSTLGLSCGWGGATHLCRLINRRIALHLLISGRVLDAQEAHARGLCEHVRAHACMCSSAHRSHSGGEWTRRVRQMAERHHLSSRPRVACVRGSVEIIG
jgi:ethylmalonyl-CoA/methylmalonyl-CoA decarboxylase